MAASVSFNICPADDCLSLTFSETTGAYSTNNLQGWNSPNQATSAATSATLVVTDPALTSTTFNLFTQNPKWPTTNSGQLFYIYPVNLNQGNTKFIDGQYKFTYTVTTSTTTYTKTIYQLFYCNVACCVDQMFAKITDVGCGCQEDLIIAATDASALLEVLADQARCGKVSLFNQTLQVLNRLCTNINCTTCG